MSAHDSIRELMSSSPKACSPTDKRVDYLVKAKEQRANRMSNKKRENGGSISRSIFTASNHDMTAADWASNGRVISNRDAANASAFKKRNMTFDAGRDSQLEKRLAASPMPSMPNVSPIQVMK